MCTWYFPILIAPLLAIRFSVVLHGQVYTMKTRSSEYMRVPLPVGGTTTPWCAYENSRIKQYF